MEIPTQEDLIKTSRDVRMDTRNKTRLAQSKNYVIEEIILSPTMTPEELARQTGKVQHTPVKSQSNRTKQHGNNNTQNFQVTGNTQGSDDTSLVATSTGSVPRTNLGNSTNPSSDGNTQAKSNNLNNDNINKNMFKDVNNLQSLANLPLINSGVVPVSVNNQRQVPPSDNNLSTRVTPASESTNINNLNSQKNNNSQSSRNKNLTNTDFRLDYDRTREGGINEQNLNSNLNLNKGISSQIVGATSRVIENNLGYESPVFVNRDEGNINMLGSVGPHGSRLHSEARGGSAFLVLLQYLT
ncbi:hypothetical protein KQX54_014357 [Cotesia glomerata]|uniref:Uncharacterized protein n=1 Tax=Cotesia glomerata TaxID=32391 RepID=A0AAV7I5Y5_COTGL|nr:hypothetical protein KQX54_014357 [Cotesia glomerata]